MQKVGTAVLKKRLFKALIIASLFIAAIWPLIIGPKGPDYRFAEAYGWWGGRAWPPPYCKAPSLLPLNGGGFRRDGGDIGSHGLRRAPTGGRASGGG